MIVASALMCLALNIYHESRGEMIPGQYAVALVTMNRAGGKKEKVCEQTFKPKQFSWANNGVVKTDAGWELSAGLIPKNKQAWKLAKKIAQTTLAGKMADFTWGSTFYHSRTVVPYWTARATPVKKVGSHIFYALHYQS